MTFLPDRANCAQRDLVWEFCSCPRISLPSKVKSTCRKPRLGVHRTGKARSLVLRSWHSPRGSAARLRSVPVQRKVPLKSSCLPKLFLRLPTKIQASDYPLTLAKPFFHFPLVDSKEVRFYHRHWEFLRVLGQNPPLSASY
jgi:hypothetical protein